MEGRKMKRYYGRVASHYYDFGQPAKFMSVMSSASPEDILPLLQQALMGEFQQWDLYTAYRGMLLGDLRDVIGDHFEEHAADELQHIEVLERYIMGMSAVPTIGRHPVPAADALDSHVIIALQLKFERQAIDLYEKILALLAEENSGLRVDVENILAKEQEHAHDLQLMLGG
jgi:bacterioferritin